jgi:hypothetical protein
MPIIGVIISFLTSWFARFVGVQAIRFIALKAILGVLVMTILPTVLYNLLTLLLQEIMSLVSSNVTSAGLQPFTYQMVGIAGWLGGIAQLPQAFSVILSAVAFRLMLSFIPFLNRM